MQISNVDTSNLSKIPLGGKLRLRDPMRLIHSIGLQQKSNSEPLNPEPVNGYFINQQGVLHFISKPRSFNILIPSFTYSPTVSMLCESSPGTTAMPKSSA